MNPATHDLNYNGTYPRSELLKKAIEETTAEFFKKNNIKVNIRSLSKNSRNNEELIMNLVDNIPISLQPLLIDRYQNNNIIKNSSEFKRMLSEKINKTIKSVDAAPYTSSKDKKCKVFISHRSTDKNYANAIRRLLLYCDVEEDSIFCSSLPGNGVKESIRSEIKTSLQNSLLDIMLVSQQYTESPYCMNEMGAIWFKDDSHKLIILVDPISEDELVGFPFPDQKYRRIEQDSEEILEVIIDSLGLKQIKPTQVKKIISDLKNDWGKCKSDNEPRFCSEEQAVQNDYPMNCQAESTIQLDDELALETNGCEVKLTLREFLIECGNELIEPIPNCNLIKVIKQYLSLKKKIAKNDIEGIAKQLSNKVMQILYGLEIVDTYKDSYDYPVSWDESIPLCNETFWKFTEYGLKVYKKSIITKPLN